MAVTEGQVEGLLLAAFPRGRATLEGWGENSSPYLPVALLAREVVAAAREGMELASLFGAVERLFVEGSPEVQTLMGAGFLEDLQTRAMQEATADTRFDPDIFLRWLGPTSVGVWSGLLTGLRGSPQSLTAFVEQDRAVGDPRSMSRPELRQQARQTRRRKS